VIGPGFSGFTNTATGSANPWRDLGIAFWGGGWVLVFFAIINSALANSNAGATAASRVLYSLGRNGAIPRAFGRTHPTHKTPHVAILAQTVLGIGVALLLGWKYDLITAFSIIATAVTIVVIVVYILVCFATVVFFSRRGDYNPWVHWVMPLAGAAVFTAVVLPVAALDFRAFYADIVAYNVGLPGADNYPIGGTPGFGFANFLIYFGGVASLRDYFPFGLFYVLLVPLGLVLAHRQLREGTPEAALFTGTVALLASLYLSRVVHPNYLVPAAILLPLAFLAARREADAALVPLALLALAVEFVEGGGFREAWSQAVATGRAGIASGLPSWLLPKAGPGLTDDPLGLLFGALAAGLAVLYVVGVAVRAPGAARTSLVTLGAVVVVGVPTWVMTRIGERTGVPRTQDAWVVQAWADAARLAEGRSPYAPPPADAPRGREAWPSSFRLEPAKELVPDRPLLPPGATTLGAWLRPLGLRDPRPLALAALVVLALAAARLAGPGARPLAVGLALLLPPLAVGTVFGSPAALSLAGLVAAWATSLRGASARAGLGGGIRAGLAGAFDHRAWLAVPFAVGRAPGRVPAWRWTLAGVAVGYLALVLPAMLPDASAFLARFLSGFTVGPGIGLANVFLYWGAERTGLSLALFAAAPVLAALVAIGLVVRRVPPLPAAAVATLAGLWLAPAVSAEAVALPLVLAALAPLADGVEG